MIITWRHFSEIWQLQDQTDTHHIRFQLLNFLLMTFVDEAKAMLLGAGADSHAHHLATLGKSVCELGSCRCVCANSMGTEPVTALRFIGCRNQSELYLRARDQSCLSDHSCVYIYHFYWPTRLQAALLAICCLVPIAH